MRGGHKVHFRKLFSDVSRVIEKFTDVDESELLTLRGCLERKATLISKLDEEILESIEEEEEINKEIEEQEELQNKIRKKVIEIDKVMKKVYKNEEEKKRIKTTDGKERTYSDTKVKVRLPKLEIEKFSGDPKRYRAFKDAFDLVTNHNESLTNIEKFTYLQSYIKGEA